MDILTLYIYIQSFPHCERIGFNPDEHIIATTWKVKNFQLTRGLFLFFSLHIFTKSKEIKIGEEIGKRIYRSTNIHSKMNGNYLISVSAMFNSLVQCSALWPVTNRARYVHALRINAAGFNPGVRSAFVIFLFVRKPSLYIFHNWPVVEPGIQPGHQFSTRLFPIF